MVSIYCQCCDDALLSKHSVQMFDNFISLQISYISIDKLEFGISTLPHNGISVWVSFISNMYISYTLYRFQLDIGKNRDIG